MHRIDGPAAAPGNLFTEGDPSVGTPATIVTDDWTNAVQEEICNVITGAGIALAKPSNTQLLAAINELLRQRVPPGAIQQFAMTAVPTGWLKCNGQAVSRTGFAGLFAAIGTIWGAGDGTTTFSVPDLRGEFLRGWDDGRGLDSSRVFGSTQVDSLKAHTHGIRTDDGAGFNPSGPSGQVRGTDRGLVVTVSSDPTGGTETRPRNVAIMWCIRA